MSETKTTTLLKQLVKKVRWYDYIGFIVWIVALYLSLDISLSFLNEPGIWGQGAASVTLMVFAAILIIGIVLRLGIYYLLQRRKPKVKP